MLHSLKANPVMALSVLCGAAWLAVDGLVLPPDFGGTDIYYFKDAGINFAEGLGFVTRFTFGNPTFDYQVYALYPPLYALLFGIFVKLFGVSALSNQIFNSLVSFALATAIFFALKPLWPNWAQRTAGYIFALIFVTAVITGFYLPETDRPDALGACFGLLAFVALNRKGPAANEFGAGLLCGLTLVTSPFAGIWTAIGVALVVAARHYPKGGFRRAVARLLLAASGAVAVVALAGGLAAVFLTGWFSAFLGVLTGTTTNNETGGGYFLALLRGDVSTWAGGFPTNLPGFYLGLAKLAAVQIALFAALVFDRFRSGAAWRGWPVLALLAASPLCLITSPYQAHYPPLTGALLLGAAAAITAGMPPDSRQRYAAAIIAGFALVILLSLPYKGREAILRSGARPSMERALSFIGRNRNVFAGESRLLAVSPTTYILWRQKGIRPLTSIYSGFDDPENRKKLAGLALAYPGSGDPLSPQQPRWLRETEYRLVYRPELPQVPTILGRPVTRSSQTWESAIYERRDEANPPSIAP